MKQFFFRTRLLGVLILTFGLGIGMAFFPGSGGSLSGTFSALAKEFEDQEEDQAEIEMMRGDGRRSSAIIRDRNDCPDQ